MNDAVQKLICAIASIVDVHSAWLYGSVVLGDFRLGWSDIDLLVLTEAPIETAQANALVMLRQTLCEREPDNPYYRSFEGIIVDRAAYFKQSPSRLAYWGTSGQRVTDRFERDIFAEWELSKYGRCVYGQNDRRIFLPPTQADLIRAVRAHYDGIRACAKETDERLYSCGWLLDIARCIYTLRFGEVIGKTQAGEWAIREHLFSDDAPLLKTLEIRRDPLRYKDLSDTKQWLKALGPIVQQYADVLENELQKTGGNR